MTLVSIITITREDIAGLRRTLASLKDIQDVEVEHLIIDGASSDGSAAWARQNQVFANTVVTSEPDAGIYDAMNKGLRQATGDLVCFLNSGDCIAGRSVLRTVVDSFDDRGFDWGFGLGQMVDKQGKPVRWPQKPTYSWLRETFWQYNIYHPSVYMRKEFLMDLGGFDQRFSIAADYHLLVRAGRRSQPLVWPQLMAVALDGGLSTRSITATQWQAHRARVDALELRGVSALVDAVWTVGLMAKTRGRRAVGDFLRARDWHRRAGALRESADYRP